MTSRKKVLFVPKCVLATYNCGCFSPRQIRRRALTSRRNVVKISNSTVGHDLNLWATSASWHARCVYQVRPPPPPPPATFIAVFKTTPTNVFRIPSSSYWPSLSYGIWIHFLLVCSGNHRVLISIALLSVCSNILLQLLVIYLSRA